MMGYNMSLHLVKIFPKDFRDIDQYVVEDSQEAVQIEGKGASDEYITLAAIMERYKKDAFQEGSSTAQSSIEASSSSSTK